MKKNIIIILCLILISCGVKGQSILEAQKIKNALENRPYPDKFTEKEAWNVLTGEKSVSDKYFFNISNYKYFHLLKQSRKGYKWFYRQDGWWITGDDIKTGSWSVNWILGISFIFSLLFSYLLNDKLIEKFTTKRNQLEMSFSSTRFISMKDRKTITFKALRYFSNGFISALIVGVILSSIASATYDEYLFIPALFFVLSGFIPYLRIKSEIKKEETISKDLLIAR